jgi:hypothetical protein
MAVELSVILVVGKRRERAAVALASVLSQEVDGGMLEVLLIDCAPGSPAIEGSAQPNVRTIAASASATFAEAKVLGILESQAPVIAFLEEHAFVASGWAKALLNAHREPCVGVGAEVHNGNPERWLSRSVAVMNYHFWFPPARRAEFTMLPGHNVSFKRDALLAYGDRLRGLLRTELVLHTRLHRDGGRMLLEPDAKFFHLNEIHWRDCVRGFFLFHRLYAPARAREFCWTAARRALYIAGSPLVPAYFLLRFFAFVLRERPDLFRSGLSALPLILVVQTIGAVGQAVGLLLGPGGADRAFSAYELESDRGPMTVRSAA